jgi:hypothetical protein
LYKTQVTTPFYIQVGRRDVYVLDALEMLALLAVITNVNEVVARLRLSLTQIALDVVFFLVLLGLFVGLLLLVGLLLHLELVVLVAARAAKLGICRARVCVELVKVVSLAVEANLIRLLPGGSTVLLQGLPAARTVHQWKPSWREGRKNTEERNTRRGRSVDRQVASVVERGCVELVAW